MSVAQWFENVAQWIQHISEWKHEISFWHCIQTISRMSLCPSLVTDSDWPPRVLTEQPCQGLPDKVEEQQGCQGTYGYPSPGFSSIRLQTLFIQLKYAYTPKHIYKLWHHTYKREQAA